MKIQEAKDEEFYLNCWMMENLQGKRKFLVKVVNMENFLTEELAGLLAINLDVIIQQYIHGAWDHI